MGGCLEFGQPKKEEQKTAAPEAVLVRAGAARLRRLDRTLEISGEIEAMTRTEIGAKLSGLSIVELFVDLGSVVKSGDMLCRLDATESKRDVADAEIAVREGKGRIAEAEVTLKELQAQERGQNSVIAQSQRAYDRAKAQTEKGALSAEALENAQYKLEQDRSMHERIVFQIEKQGAALELLRRAGEKAELAKKKAEETLDRTVVRAPFDGIVASRTARLGAIVQAGTPLFEIFDPQSLCATSQVTQRDLPFVRPGQTVEVRSDAYPDETFQGTIYVVSPVVDRTAGTIPVRIAVDDRDRLKLKPGLFVSGRIVLERRDDVLVVPKKAVLYERERPYVYRIDAADAAGTGRAKRLFFKEGLSDRDEVEARFDDGAEALKPGASIVLVGQDRLRDGDALTIETAAASRDAAGAASQPAKKG
jgi:RND family efflux transporter MFP subunit